MSIRGVCRSWDRGDDTMGKGHHREMSGYMQTREGNYLDWGRVEGTDRQKAICCEIMSG